MPDTNTPQVLINPLKPALIHGVAQKLRSLVRVQADPDPATTKQRKPYHLSLVIDRSGSMSGEPLRAAVRCARHIIDRLMGDPFRLGRREKPLTRHAQTIALDDLPRVNAQFPPAVESSLHCA